MKWRHDRPTVAVTLGADDGVPYVRDFPVPDGDVCLLFTAIFLPIVAVDAPARSTLRYSSLSRLNRIVRTDLFRSVN